MTAVLWCHYGSLTNMKLLAPRNTPLPVHPPARRIMTTSTLAAPTAKRSGFKTVLWVGLGFTTLFVFITSEVFLVADYPMYHGYRLQVISDRHLLIPHILAAFLALLIGHIIFSTQMRQHHLQLHCVLG